MAEPLPEENGDHERGASTTKQRRASIDKDAQEMVIESLRSQVQDLFSQVSQLNNKLVKSYDRVSDLEDDLHVASANVRASSLKISQLELERTQHLSALNTGLLVEKSHVTTELNRLMEKATEEAAQRGQAESARLAIEKDLDDLSATLFGQANSMVAEARFDKHLSERKVEEAERALKTAEEAVQLMQTQMQTILGEKDQAEIKAREMEQMMGKGKWVQRRNSDVALAPLRLLNSHAPYLEYLSFIAHLRVLHPTSPSPPAMSTLLQLPLLARLLTEDSEPTVRLDLAPSLNWLSRRSVLIAIYSGQLTIEPMSVTTLFAESSTYPTSTTVAGMNSSHDNISCALCGASIFAASNEAARSSLSNLPLNYPSSWPASSFFKKSNSGSVNGTQPPSPTHPTHRTSQVFIFRLASVPNSSIASLPIPSLTKSLSQSSPSPIPSNSHQSSGYSSSLQSNSATPNNQPTTIYPLCMSGWCLTRLRATCTLWAFVRTGVVDKVWEEDLPPPPPPTIEIDSSTSSEKPPVPPRKRGLWGIASAIGERAASWSGDESKEKAKKVLSSSTSAVINTALPSPPPHHPASTQAPVMPRRLPPPLPPAAAAAGGGGASSATASHAPAPAAAPPPLPRRSEGRAQIATPPPPPPRRSIDNTTTSTSTSETTPPTSIIDKPEAPVPPVRPPRRSVDLTSEPLSPVRGTHLRSQSTARPQTPSNIALPESRPGTPSEPSRTSSPAITLVAATGPPPPLPRRAAARAKVVSPGGGSRPGTPRNDPPTAVAPPAAPSPHDITQELILTENKVEGGEAESDVQDNGGVQLFTADSAETVYTSASSSEPSNEARANPEQPDNGDRLTRPSSSGSDLYVDAPTPGEETHIEGSVQESLTAEEETDAQEDTREHDDADNATIIDVRTPIVANQTPGESPSVVIDELSEEPVHINGEDAQETEDDESVARSVDEEKLEEEQRQRELKEKEDKYKTGYVGDATWEEKTWKELTRLREDMFWARVGGFRD